MDELADSPISLRNLVGWRVFVCPSPEWRFDAYIEITGASGKNRIARVDQDKDFIQIGRQLALSVLLPPPTRSEPKLPSGEVTLQKESYLVDEIVFTERFDQAKRAIDLTPVTIRLRNKDHSFELDYAERLARVRAVLGSSDALPESLRPLLRRLLAALQGRERLSASLEASVLELHRRLVAGSSGFALEERDDLLVALEQIVAYAVGGSGTQDLLDTLVKRAKRQLAGLRREPRGQESERFKREVVRRYSSRCVACGLELPAFAPGMNPGIDACHILPYSAYDLDHVRNGVALCKLHHWAYDQGVLSLGFRNGDYRVGLMEQAVAHYSAATLRQLEAMLPSGGAIPIDRLPADPGCWPDPRYLDLKVALGY